MRLVQLMRLFAMAGLLSTSACFYDPDESKIFDEDAAIGDGGSTDTENTDTEEDGGTSSASEWPWSGLGIVCESESDCDEYDADYCLINPTSPDEPGRCTIIGCDTKGCPELYQCCDCSLMGYGIMCVPDSYAALIASYCQCS